MTLYIPRKRRRFALTAFAIRSLARLFDHWLLLLAVALVASPVGPHLRIQYSFIDDGGGRQTMIECDYFGSRGMVRKPGPNCPVITIIDTRKPNRNSRTTSPESSVFIRTNV